MRKPTGIVFKKYLKQKVIQTGLQATSIASDLGMFPGSAGMGAIFTLHRVEPSNLEKFNPGAHLSITPEFLEKAILTLKERNYHPVALKDLPEYLENPDPKRRAMVFTLDDGYLNNFEHALPVFKKHDVPFTVFACSGFINRSHTMWWETAAELIKKVDYLTYDVGHGERTLMARGLMQKYSAYEQIVSDMMSIEQYDAVAAFDKVALEHGVDAKQIADELIMTREQLKELSSEPLADIGAHTISHPNLTKSSDDSLLVEMSASRDAVTAITGIQPETFAFPYGGSNNASEREFELAKELGFKAAVTTCADVLTEESSQKLNHLCRISLNGYYQKRKYVEALASGIVFDIGDRLKGRG